MIGVVGPVDERLSAALDRAGAATRKGDAQTVVDADPEAVIAVGEDATIDLLAAGLDAPFLPVEAGFGPLDLTVEGAIEAVAGLRRGRLETRRVPTLSVTLGGDVVGRALFDVTLVTSDPARISEYRVEHDGPIAQFRADGVVVATPIGSRGYASDAGGPIVEADGNVVSVVPVGAFTMTRRHWAFDLDGTVGIEVTREENEVSLLLDGRVTARVSAPASIEVEPGLPLETVDPSPASRE